MLAGDPQAVPTRPEPERGSVGERAEGEVEGDSSDQLSPLLSADGLGAVVLIPPHASLQTRWERAQCVRVLGWGGIPGTAIRDL